MYSEQHVSQYFRLNKNAKKTILSENYYFIEIE